MDRRRSIRRLGSILVAIFTVALVGLAPSASWAGEDAESSGPETLDALLGAFATVTGLEAEFVEEKQLGLLSTPLESSGYLYFEAPGRLARHTVRPTPSIVVVEEDAVRMEGPDGVQIVDVSAHPQIRPLVASLLWLFEGRRDALEEAWTLDFSAADGSWELAMTPRDADLASIIARMTFVGTGSGVDSIRVEETNGDTSVTRIGAANSHRVFTDAERARFFGQASP